MSDYERIMDHKHYQSKKRPHMSMISRAAQFAPFAALTGFEEAVNETGRQTSEKVELAEDAVKDIDRVLRQAVFSHEAVVIKYFLPDPLKHGGSYITVTGFIYKIDMSENVVIMEDGSAVLLYSIVDIALQDV